MLLMLPPVGAAAGVEIDVGLVADEEGCTGCDADTTDGDDTGGTELGEDAEVGVVVGVTGPGIGVAAVGAEVGPVVSAVFS